MEENAAKSLSNNFSEICGGNEGCMLNLAIFPNLFFSCCFHKNNFFVLILFLSTYCSSPDGSWNWCGSSITAPHQLCN
jgi:hypothetical protein